MSREVRMVPAGWQHPRYTEENSPGEWAVGRYIPLMSGDFESLAKEWDEANRLWNEEGKLIYFDGEVRLVKDLGCESYEDWHGQKPVLAEYMPQWPAEERTHFMMYETTSEGTPISPAFVTAEELARWLTDNNASAFASMTVTYAQWLATIRAGRTVGSAVSMNGGPLVPSAAADDYESAARNAGWLCKGGLWFNERFDGPEAAKLQDSDIYETAREVCEGEGITLEQSN